MPTEYAHALYRSTKELTTKKEIVARVESLVDVLRTEGKMKALPGIVREYERIQASHSAGNPTLTVAKEADTKRALAELKKHLENKKADTQVVIDETLIGGWRYSDKDTLLDTSYKNALLELYRRITKN